MISMAKAYGTALFELACEQKVENCVYHKALLLQKALQENPQMLSLLASPLVSTREKHEIIANWSLDCALLENTIQFMCKQQNGVCVLDCLCFFIKQYQSCKNIAHAQIISAIELTPEIKSMLKNTLASVTNQDLIFEYIIDLDCIGGLKILIDNRVFDMSVQGQLEQFQTTLTQRI